MTNIDDGSNLPDFTVKFNEIDRKYGSVIRIIAALAIVVMIMFAILNFKTFTKNACQICEDSGRYCYEKHEKQYNMPDLEGFSRIEYPENLKPLE